MSKLSNYRVALDYATDERREKKGKEGKKMIGAQSLVTRAAKVGTKVRGRNNPGLLSKWMGSKLVTKRVSR